jgi:hypothetical protein
MTYYPEGMETQQEQIAPELIQALIAKATARGLSINEYLRQILGLSNGTNNAHEETAPRNEAMYAALQTSAERLKDVPVSGSTEETLKIIREGRSGAMWGHEPTDTE